MNFASKIQIARSSSIRLSPERPRGKEKFALDALRADLIKHGSITPATFQRTFGQIELRWDRRVARS